MACCDEASTIRQAVQWGPRTCERRSPCYNFSTEAQCNWHGSSWPFETSKTLTGLANLLQAGPVDIGIARHSQQTRVQNALNDVVG